jgi:spoIIIJ-associated protein
MEQHIQRSKTWLEELLALMGFTATVKVEEKKDYANLPNIWLVIDDSHLSPEQIEILIGYKGKGLDALQYLINAQMNLGAETDHHHTFTIELNGYRLRRQAELLAWCQEIADKVRQTKQPVEMTELSSAERRQIHTFFQNESDLETESQGQEPDRRLVVRFRYNFG